MEGGDHGKRRIAVVPITLDLLYEALSQPFGVALATNDLEKARQKLYRLRQGAKDPDLDCLAFVQSPTDPLQLWIVRKNAPK